MDGFEYVQSLSIDEKILFLKLIIKMINANGEVDDYERVFIKDVAKQYKVPSDYAEAIHSKISFEELLKQAKNMLNRNKCLYLIKELLSVANTNNDFNECEIDMIVKVSEALGIEDEKVTELNQLVLDRLNWLERYRTALEIVD